MSAHLPRISSRRGFSLLEVMVALGILTTTLVILAQTQATAVTLTFEAERVVTAADLARMKMSEALLEVERGGFQVSDVSAFGDFDEFGDDLLNMEYGRELKDFHWESLVSEVDIEMLGDLAGAADSMGGGGDEGGAAASSSPLDALGMVGIGPDMIAQFLGPYVREVRVRVWWGEDSKTAEDDGTEIVLTTHIINPGGALALEQGLPQ